MEKDLNDVAEEISFITPSVRSGQDPSQVVLYS